MPPMPARRTVEVSVVVEWETVLEGDLSRGARCLDALRTQVQELACCETVICFDPCKTTEASARAAIGEHWPGSILVTAAPSDSDYYGKKNYGFTLTSGELIVFLDSDVVPEPDWLHNLVASFDDFRPACVVGRTHLDTASTYDRAVALFWIFEARDRATALRPTRRLVSNNVAFRRALFTHLRFPDRPTFRGQCSELASILTQRGIAMYEQPSARGSHPAPDGVRRFLVRAVHAGRDHAFYDRLAGHTGLRRCGHNWREDLRHVRERIAQRAPLIEAGRADVLAAHLLGIAYYSAKSLGYAASGVRHASGNADAGGAAVDADPAQLPTTAPASY